MYGSGTMIYVRDCVPSKLIEISNFILRIFDELNLLKKKWLLCRPFSVHKGFNSEHLSINSRNLDAVLKKYDNVFLIRDLIKKNDPSLKDFCQLNGLKHLIFACYKPVSHRSHVNNPSRCIFQNSCAVEKG